MFAVFDVETTGLAVQRDRIVEIAIVGLDGDGAFEWEWSTLVNPGTDPGPTWAHGITNRELSAALPIDHYLGHIIELLRGRCLVAHNIKFDLAFLRMEFLRSASLDIPRQATICTARLARSAGFGSVGLDNCCSRLDIIHENPHTALGDARATVGVLSKLIDVHDARINRLVALAAGVAKDWPTSPVDLTVGTRRELGFHATWS